jgi:hypothetical protein
MPSHGSASDEIARIIKAHGGVLKRHNKHLLYTFPGGAQFTRSCTPSDIHAEDNALRDLKRILNLNGERGVEGERRARAVKHERSTQPVRSGPTIKSALAEQLALAGLAEAAHASEVEKLRSHISRLQRECRLKDRSIRWRKRRAASLRDAWGIRLSKWTRGWWPRIVAAWRRR